MVARWSSVRCGEVRESAELAAPQGFEPRYADPESVTLQNCRAPVCPDYAICLYRLNAMGGDASERETADNAEKAGKIEEQSLGCYRFCYRSWIRYSSPRLLP